MLEPEVKQDNIHKGEDSERDDGNNQITPNSHADFFQFLHIQFPTPEPRGAGAHYARFKKLILCWNSNIRA